MEGGSADNQWNGNGINVFPHYGRAGGRAGGRARADGRGRTSLGTSARASSSFLGTQAVRSRRGRGRGDGRTDGRFINRPRIAVGLLRSLQQQQ